MGSFRNPVKAIPKGNRNISANIDADLRFVKEIVSRSGSSFVAGMRVLPNARRNAIYAVYAFCREVDDISDLPGDPTLQFDRLHRWRAEIGNLYSGAPSHPITRTLAEAIDRYELPESEFLEIINGVEMDLNGAMNFPPNLRLLNTYCQRVAGAVGKFQFAFLESRIRYGTKSPNH